MGVLVDGGALWVEPDLDGGGEAAAAGVVRCVARGSVDHRDRVAVGEAARRGPGVRPVDGVGCGADGEGERALADLGHGRGLAAAGSVLGVAGRGVHHETRFAALP